MAARLTDSARMSMKSQFGEDSIPVICFGICHSILEAIDPAPLPESVRKRLKVTKNTFGEMAYEAAIDLHEARSKLIVIAPPGVNL